MGTSGEHDSESHTEYYMFCDRSKLTTRHDVTSKSSLHVTDNTRKSRIANLGAVRSSVRTRSTFERPQEQGQTLTTRSRPYQRGRNSSQGSRIRPWKRRLDWFGREYQGDEFSGREFSGIEDDLGWGQVHVGGRFGALRLPGSILGTISDVAC